jgi:hypothetical protein
VNPEKPTCCSEKVFASKAIFCKKHHTTARREDNAGTDIETLYPTWKPDVEEDVHTTPVTRFVKPLEKMKKTPRELKQEIDKPEGGARFKARYYTNLRAALGVSKCQTCGNKKIEVLTDSSLLLCEQCLNKGKHIIADQLTGELIGNIGWATAQGKLKKLSSQASLENEEGEDYRTPPPALSQR